MEWQSIESAPKDGTAVLLFAADGICVGLFRADEWVISQGDYVPREAGDAFWVGEPSHWMPLPEPPAQT
jgi:hypothetical protein